MQSSAKHLHILGICGTAMAAIAKLALDSGWHVTGSDAGIYPPMSDYLHDLGIHATPFSKDNLQPRPQLCVIGNAMSRGNIEVEIILNEGFNYCSGPEFVGQYILPKRHAVVVAGTHGKTSTSSMLAHILEQAKQAPGFLIGGMPKNFSGGARLGSGKTFILEGDEYDTAFFDKRSKFLHYHAQTLILNNLEYDHADIFPDLAAIQRQFSHLLRTVPSTGHIIRNADETHFDDVFAQGCWTPVVEFAHYPHPDAAWQWESITLDGSQFRIYYHGEMVLETSWESIGVHQVANACAATAAAHTLGVSIPIIEQALASFAGVKRRMSLVGIANGIRIFDDFAHHPTAISGIVSATKAAMKHQDKTLWVIVEPRSNTMRSKVHQQRLPQCFAAADAVIFTPPSHRNLANDAILDLETVCQAIGSKAHIMENTETIIKYIASHAQDGDDVLILSNGGFDNIHQRLLQTLQKKT
ncbi:MAG: UDP-N-acetylmuramate:L-alanyl-gamma-D-glutamyl-meso-diaminopimelate ligase [Mariprofundaceae bacterium]|nr:UDP-N-acetylmuramate:L-alanyl-gamma-D-glutamyl-meso-diaminopimelate ligase [Mariprofundaceae bacterium]